MKFAEINRKDSENKHFQNNLIKMFKKKIIIDIRVNYCTKFGEEIAMIWDLEELGQWNPLKAMPLHWNEVYFFSQIRMISGQRH